MQKKGKGLVKIIVCLALIMAFVWFLVLSPMITFKKNEKIVEDAARSYFDINSKLLPTGERIKTVSLETLMKESFVKEDMFIPYTKKSCSSENSWVKVKKEDNDYKYYTYLECGFLTSNVDHEGPTINLKGDKEITVDVGGQYEELGVKSVVDNKDGKIDVSEVTIKSDVDTNKIGTYEVQYIAYDKLLNKTVEKRVVKVVKTISSTVKNDLGNASNYTGTPSNNFVRLSNIMFRIYGLSGGDVVLVSDEDISNINYSKVDKWLDYFYEQLNDSAKKMIVPNKYCNMTASEDNLNTRECSSYTENKKVYIPSIVEVNNAQGEGNFMKPSTMSWVATSKDKKEAYVTRNIFFYEEAGKSFLAYDIDSNYGVRPMLTIKGNSLIVDGDGSVDNPYTFGDTKKMKKGSSINEREIGEYVSINGSVFRIVSIEKDGTTKVISNYTVGNDDLKYGALASAVGDYNPKSKGTLGYFVNNLVSEHVDTSFFANHEVNVPIYKNKIIYGEEKETKKYKAVLSAPNMYEVFSARPVRNAQVTSFWCINTSKTNGVVAALYDIGVPVNESENSYAFGVRVVGYLKDNVVVSSGKGTIQSPYILAK